MSSRLRKLFVDLEGKKEIRKQKHLMAQAIKRMQSKKGPKISDAVDNTSNISENVAPPAELPVETPSPEVKI